MPTQITLTTELSRERLLQLRDEIDAILATSDGHVPPSAATQPAEGTVPVFSDAVTEALAGQLLNRISQRLQVFVRFAVEHYDGQTFTWEQVSADMGEDLGTVKSWHRSLSKPMNRLVKENPGAPRPIEGIGWDGLRSHYRIGEGWKKAIKATWGSAGT